MYTQWSRIKNGGRTGAIRVLADPEVWGSRMGVGSGLPLCLAGIDISNQARNNMYKNRSQARSYVHKQLKKTYAAEQDSSQDQHGPVDLMNILRTDLLKQMVGLDRRREALKEQQRNRTEENKVRPNVDLHPHGAKAA